MQTQTRPPQSAAPRTNASTAESNSIPASREETIRLRAREIYLARVKSGAAGDATSDWLQAEREYQARPAKS